jgi:hypothetical protein
MHFLIGHSGERREAIGVTVINYNFEPNRVEASGWNEDLRRIQV